MRAIFSLHNSKTKRILAGFLAVWMSGIALLFCCGAMNARAGAEIDSCPLAKLGHCSKSEESENAYQFEAPSAEAPVYDCCGFLPQLLDKARKIEFSQQIAAFPAVPNIIQPRFITVQIKSLGFPEYRSLPLDRSETYLRNRVFRI